MGELEEGDREREVRVSLLRLLSCDLIMDKWKEMDIWMDGRRFLMIFGVFLCCVFRPPHIQSTVHIYITPRIVVLDSRRETCL